MLRVLALIVIIIVLREFVVRKRKRSPTMTSPYINSLDEVLSADQLSVALEETAKFQTHARRRAAFR